MDILKDISSSAKFLPWLQAENITLVIRTYQTNCLFLIGTHALSPYAIAVRF